MRVALEHRVPHPVEDVFAMVSDPSRRAEWQENTSDVRVEGPLPATVGTRWTEQQRGVGHVEAEITAHEQDRLYAERGDTSAGVGRVTVTFASDGDGGTMVGMEVELTLKGLKKALEPALAPMVRHQLPKDLDRLSALLDREAG